MSGTCCLSSFTCLLRGFSDHDRRWRVYSRCAGLAGGHPLSRSERSLFLVAFMCVFVFMTSLILSISGRCVSIEGGTTNIDQTSRTSVSELHSRVAQGYVRHAGELVEPLHQMVERPSGWWPLRSDSLCGRASRGCSRSWTRPGSTRFLSWRVQRTTSLSGRWTSSISGLPGHTQS